MSVVLYRKYRSQDFGELVGQDHIAHGLENALKTGKIGHAYLFTGPRGTGKTSTARILARRINNLSLEEAADHLDIIEIDAASNRRIDEIRDLREKAHIAPASAPYKVYIIDEVHMLTTEAFNALLKTLEEPPSHVVFILATTEPHKLPDTIISRTQRYSFKPVSESTLAAHLRSIADKEKMDITDSALALIASLGEGSFRDALSILDQLSSHSGQITDTTVVEAIGLADWAVIHQLAVALAEGNTRATLTQFDRALQNGSSAQQIVRQLLNLLQKIAKIQLGIEKAATPETTALAESFTNTDLLTIMQRCAELPNNALNMELALEAVLLHFANRTTTVGTATITEVESPKAKVSAPDKAKQTASKALEFSEALWIKALSLVKQQNNSLYSLLRAAHPTADEGKIQVAFKFQFHRKRLEEAHNRRILEEALSKVFGRKIPVEATSLAAAKAPATPAAKQEDDDTISKVLDILGGEVVHG